jgi:hypothetical protein
VLTVAGTFTVYTYLALVAAAFSLAALIPVIAAGDKLEAGP